MPQYKLHYFNGRGRAEIVRYIFELKDVKYEDLRHTGDQFKELKSKFPTGQMPVLEVDGEILSQSMAITRYLAREYGLYGSSSLEYAAVDAVVDTSEDMLTNMIPVYFEQDEAKKEVLKKKFADEQLPAALGRLEKLLAQNKQGDDYFVGKSITIADLTFLRCMETAAMIAPASVADLSKSSPKLEAIYSKVKSNDKIAAWIVKRPESSF